MCTIVITPCVNFSNSDIQRIHEKNAEISILEQKIKCNEKSADAVQQQLNNILYYISCNLETSESELFKNYTISKFSELHKSPPTMKFDDSVLPISHKYLAGIYINEHNKMLNILNKGISMFKSSVVKNTWFPLYLAYAKQNGLAEDDEVIYDVCNLHYLRTKINEYMLTCRHTEREMSYIDDNPLIYGNNLPIGFIMCEQPFA